MVPVIASGLGLQLGVNLIASLAQRVLAPERPGETFADALSAQSASDAQSAVASKSTKMFGANRGLGMTNVSSASAAPSARTVSEAYAKLG